MPNGMSNLQMEILAYIDLTWFSKNLDPVVSQVGGKPGQL